MATALPTPMRDETSRVVLAHTSDAVRPLQVSIAAHLVYAAEVGRVRCARVRVLCELFAREEIVA